MNNKPVIPLSTLSVADFLDDLEPPPPMPPVNRASTLKSRVIGKHPKKVEGNTVALHG